MVTVREMSGQRSVGRELKRVEDPRLVTGQGQYLDDLRIEGVAEVAILRSPHAHARIRSIDTSAALARPGVLAVVTVADLEQVGGVPVEGNLKVPAHPPLARGTVKFVGDPVAAVIAENRYVAHDALEAIVVEYEPLPAVVDPREALREDAPLVHEEFESNIAMSTALEAGDVEAEFTDADYRMPVHVGHSRVAAIPIEPRGGIAAYDAVSDSFTLWLSTQAAWSVRTDLAKALGIAEERIRVITPDVGGAFGAKMTLYREDILLAALARLVGRPVRWVATRSEDLLASMHGREAYTDGEVAFDADGRIRALRLRTVANFGAYLMKYSAGPVMRMLLFPTGAYDIRHVHSQVIGVFTNTGPMGPYRGAGRPEAAYFIERVMSDVARFLGMDQAEIRRRNFIPKDAFPYTNAANVVYDSGDYERALNRALELIDIERVQHDLAERRARGEIVGLGIACCVEVSGGGWESGKVQLKADGHVVAVTGTSPHGQGLATSFAQIIADELGIPIEDIEVTYGDTAIGPKGFGTMASRSLQLGGSALQQAARQIREQLLAQAAELLEVSPGDLVCADGKMYPTGVPERALTIGEVVQACLASRQGDNVASDGIEAAVEFRADASFPFGTTIALVSIDRETGRPTLERFVSVDDVGTVVNPILVEGQLVGGAVQGISEALWEQVIYDASGQLLTGTLLDYAVPRASWLPPFELDRTVTPSPSNPLGAKGVGEAGTVHAPPAVANAVMDALRPFGVRPLDLPLTPEKIWQVLHRRAGGRGDAVPDPNAARS